MKNVQAGEKPASRLLYITHTELIKMNEDEVIEKIGNICGKVCTGIALFGIGLAIGIPFLGLLSGDKEYPLE